MRWLNPPSPQQDQPQDVDKPLGLSLDQAQMGAQVTYGPHGLEFPVADTSVCLNNSGRPARPLLLRKYLFPGLLFMSIAVYLYQGGEW